MSTMLYAKSDDTRPYPVTPADALWLARAVQAEGPERDSVAAVLVNGFVWARTMKGFRGTLTDWVRAYSQPVNPRWYEYGDLFQAQLATMPSEDHAEQLAKARKRARVHSTLNAFSADTKQAVTRALSGTVPLKVGNVDFAAPWAPERPARRPLEPIPIGRNRMFTRIGAENWQGYRVERESVLLKSLLWLCAFGLAAVGVRMMFAGKGA